LFSEMIFKRTYLAVEDTRNVESTRKTNNDASELLLRDDDCESQLVGTGVTMNGSHTPNP
jgi:hypothetical protein